MKRVEIINAYLYNFAQHTESEFCQSLNTYNIILISEDKELSSEFKKVITKGKIKKKQIFLEIHENADHNLNHACIIFIAEDKSNLYPSILKKTKDSQALLITENYYDKREIMLNLVKTIDNRMTFEINKANIYERNISISDEMLMSGGTEIDIIELYLKSKKDLISSENKLKNNHLKIENLNKQISNIDTKLSDLKLHFEKQNTLVQEQIELIEKQKKENQTFRINIENNQKEILFQKSLINFKKKKLTVFADSLTKSKNQLLLQKQELNDGLHRLKVLKDEIRIKNNELKVQEYSLGEQYDIIKKKNTFNKLFITIIILGSFLFITLLIGFINRKKRNKVLQQQKEEINHKSLLIADHLEKKRMINKLLISKNEELKSIIKQLHLAQEQLVQSEKMASLGVLTAGIAHEINNPINFVYTGINSLKKDFIDIKTVIEKIKEINPDDDNLKEKIKAINTLKKDLYFDEALEAIPQTMEDIRIGANRTAEIVGGLRRFSRMDENKFIRSDIHEYLQTALVILKNKYKGIIKISRKYDKHLPEIYCNPGKITQVFMNIIFNAIDAIKTKKNNTGEIIIQTSIEKNTIKISIKDNGCGMDEATKKKIFDPFFTTKDVGSGTGLGLSISFGIIKEHNGIINVKSEIEEGTEFIIFLPLKE